MRPNTAAQSRTRRVPRAAHLPALRPRLRRRPLRILQLRLEPHRQQPCAAAPLPTCRMMLKNKTSNVSDDPEEQDLQRVG